MTDYLTMAYNAKMQAIQEHEAASLASALALYADATRQITEQAAQERMEAGIADAAARRQRDHEYHNGRSAPNDPPAEGSYDPADHVEKLTGEPSDVSKEIASVTEPENNRISD